MNRFFLTNYGKLGFLEQSQKDVLISTLLSQLTKDESTRYAAMWALLWLTGGRTRIRNDKLSDFVLLDSKAIKIIEETLQSFSCSPSFIANGCLILTRDKLITPVVNQLEWLYELAMIADGKKKRREFPHFTSPDIPSVRLDWIKDQLNKDFPMKTRADIALSLGALGVFIPEMIQPLKHIFTSLKSAHQHRDEALIYLSLIGTQDVISILVEAADSLPDDGYNYDYNSRGLFGLLLLDNIEILAEQIRKSLLHADLVAYTYGLAGSQDQRGIELLEQLKDHSNTRIYNAANEALGLPYDSDVNSQNRPKKMQYSLMELLGNRPAIVLTNGQTPSGEDFYVYIVANKYSILKMYDDANSGLPVNFYSYGDVLDFGPGLIPPSEVTERIRREYADEEWVSPEWSGIE